jgi:hypothetical protein
MQPRMLALLLPLPPWQGPTTLRLLLSLLLLLLLLPLLPLAQRRDQLRDHPLPGASVWYLDGSWVAHNDFSGLSINASVPGDIISDLSAAGVIPADIWFNVSWRDPRHVSQWANGTWTFERAFDHPTASAALTLLVFDGVKVSATHVLPPFSFPPRAAHRSCAYDCDADGCGHHVERRAPWGGDRSVPSLQLPCRCRAQTHWQHPPPDFRQLHRHRFVPWPVYVLHVAGLVAVHSEHDADLQAGVSWPARGATTGGRGRRLPSTRPPSTPRYLPQAG